MFDIFYDVGYVKNVLYFLTIGLLVFAGQDIVKPNYIVMLLLVFGIMIGISYFLCFFREDLEIQPCHACDMSQELMKSGWYFSPPKTRVH